jgi:hypothetical protein
MNAPKNKLQIIIRLMNNLFVFLVLTIFYIIAVGTVTVFLKVCQRLRGEKRQVSSYWKNSEQKELTRDYFRSPY